jgi:hypothetical protein
MKELKDSLGCVKFTIKDRVISTAREKCVKSNAKKKLFGVADVLGIGIIDKIHFVIILGIRTMMERKYRRETIIEKCQVTISSLERLKVTDSILEELE